MLHALYALLLSTGYALAAQPDTACFPPCRSGYLCHNGECISRCNPPCPQDQKCTDSGECVPNTAPPARPSSTAAKSADSAWLVVRLVRGSVFEGYEPELGVYVDDIYWGKLPQKIKVAAGLHEVALFSQQAFGAGDKEDKARMQGAFAKVDFPVNGGVILEFIYKCDVGRNDECDNNEWYFSSRISRSAP